MTENTLYVEGSTIDRLLEGSIGLKRKISGVNKILCVCNEITPLVENAVGSAMWTLGADIEIRQLTRPLYLTGSIDQITGAAVGIVEGYKDLIYQCQGIDYDHIAVYTPIDCDAKLVDYYWDHPDTANVWGRAEAELSKLCSTELDAMVVHSPTEVQSGMYAERSMPMQMAPEVISNCYFHCIAKGLHRAPKITPIDRCTHREITREDISFLVTPHGVWGRPHIAAAKAGIPIIVVEGNTTVFSAGFNKSIYADNNVLLVRNYLEATGLIMALKSGVNHGIV
jgi:hypothetical protein